MNKRFSKLSKSLVIGISIGCLGASIASAQTAIRPRAVDGFAQLRPVNVLPASARPGGNIQNPGGARAWPGAVAAVAVAVEVATRVAHHVLDSFMPSRGLIVSRPALARLGAYDR